MKKHLPILVFIITLVLYLGIKALGENNWDGWHFGSAQVLLSDKHWAQNGFFQNYLLFIPQGYSKVVRYFDDLQLRQHAHGIATGGLVGKRLYYTHYPSGFLVPTALLVKLGIEKRFWFRMLEIIFSLGALSILYWIFTMISNRLVAILGVLYYGASILFLDYADTLGNQPLDEFLHLSIIALSIAAIKKPKKYFDYFIWLLYFILAFSSYDSTFFIFAWLLGLDLIITKKVEWKKWVFWASAPVLAFGLQIFQNTLYLGWHNMLLDLFGAFKVQIVGSHKDFFISHLKRLFDPFDWFFGIKWYLGIFAALGGLLGLKIIKKYFDFELVNIKYLYLSLLAILFNFLLLPSLFFYQGRLISIFGGLLVSALTVSVVKTTNKFRSLNFNLKTIFLIILVLVISAWFVQAKRTYAYIKSWPNNVWPVESISFDKKIKNLTSSDKVIFQMSGLDRKVAGSNRYPTAASEDEYYIGSPILGFTNTDDLIHDFNYLKNRSEFPFNTIIITDKKYIMDKIRKKLTTHKAMPVEKIDYRFVMVIPE